VPTFDQIRQLYPSTKDLTDNEIIQKTAELTKLPMDTVAKSFGVEINDPGFVSDMKRGTGQVISGVGSTMRDLGMPTAGRSVESYGDDITLRNPSQIHSLSDIRDKPFTTAREAIGETLPQIAGVVGGQAVGRVGGGIVGGFLGGPPGAVIGQHIGGILGGLATTAASEYGGIRKDQRESGQEDVSRAALAAVPATLLERYTGTERLAAKVVRNGAGDVARGASVDLLSKAGAKHVARQGVLGGLEEGMTEVPQSVLERWGASKDLTSPEAIDDYGVSGIKGFIGGAAVRGGISAASRERAKNSILPNANVETGRDEISQAFEHQTPPLGMGGQDTIQTPINPYNVGGHVSNLQQGQVFNPDSPQGEMFGQAVVHDPAAVAMAQANQQQAKPGKTQEQSQEDEITNDERHAILDKYSPVQAVGPTGKVTGHTFLNKQYYGEKPPTTMTAAIDKLALEDRQKTPVQLDAEKALINTFRDKEGVARQPGKDALLMPNEVKKFSEQFVQGASDMDTVIDRLDTEIHILQKKTEAQKSKAQGGTDATRMERLQMWRDELIGAPGASKTAAAPVQAEAAAPAQQTPETTPAAKPVVDLRGEDAHNKLHDVLQNALSARDYSILIDKVYMDMSHDVIAKKHNINKSRVGQIINEEILPKIRAYAEANGMTEDDIRHLSREAAVHAATERTRASDEALARTGNAEEEDHGGRMAPSGYAENEADRDGDVHDTRPGAAEEAADDLDHKEREGVGRINTPGGSQSNWKDSTHPHERIVKLMDAQEEANEQLTDAYESGDDAKAQELEAKIEAFEKEIAAEVKKVEAADKKSKQAKKDDAETDKKSKPKKPEVKKAEPKETVETDSEKAERLWNEAAPDGMTFESLSKDGKESWTESVANGHDKLADMNRVFEAEKSLNAQAVPLEALDEHSEGVQYVFKNYHALGITHVIDVVKSWQLAQKSEIHGDGLIATTKDGEYTILLNDEMFDGRYDDYSAYVQHVVSHELGHAADLALHGEGVYSGQPEMRMAVHGKHVIPIGEVAKEIFGLYKNSETWRPYFAYPFSRSLFPDLTQRQVQMEMFAQIWSRYTSESGRKRLERDAPVTAKYMAEVIQHVQSTKEVSGSKEQVSQERSDGFKNRDARGGASTAEGVRGGGQTGGRETALAAKRLDPEAVAETAKASIEQLPKPLRSSVQTIWDTVSSAAKKGLYASAFTADILEAMKKVVPTAAKYGQLMQDKAQTRLVHEREVERILAMVDKLPKHEQGTGNGSVNKFIYDSTTSGKWAFRPSYRGEVSVDSAMEERFNKLSQPAQQLVKSVFKYGHDTLQQKQELLTKEINNEFDSQALAADSEEERASIEKERAKALRNSGKQLAQMEGPYAPLKRFGDYVVVARSKEYMEASDSKKREMETDEKHNAVEFYQTKAEAMARERELKGTVKFPAGVQAFEKEQGRNAIYGNANEQFAAFQRLKSLMDGDEELAGAAKSLRRMVQDLYLTTLAETSARKSELHRRNISGANMDMLRSFATQGRADAVFIGALKHNSDVTLALVNMRKEVGEHTDGRMERTQMMNEIIKRHADTMSPDTTPIQDKLMAGTSIWMLATSPAYYIQNSLQTYMVTLPVLNGRFGAFKAWRAVNGAYKDLAGVLNVKGDANLDNLPTDIKKAIQELLNRGRIDIGIDMDLGRFARTGETGTNSMPAKVHDFLRAGPRKLEVINRVTAAAAAYRLAIKDGMSHDQAVDYADEIIRTTHGDYSGFNAPRIMRNSFMPGAKLITQFRKYQLIQLTLLTNMFKQSFGDASPAEKLVARRALAWTMGHVMVMAGGLGLPAANLIGAVLGRALGGGDEPDDAEVQLRKLIGDKVMADLLLRGVPKMVGFDLSQKIGLGQVTSLLPFTDVNLTDQAGFEKTVFGLLGPFASLNARAASGIGSMGTGDYYKGLEQLMPTGLANGMKAYRFATEGVSKKNGDVVLSPDDISVIDAFSQGIGLPSNKLKDRQADTQAVMEYEKFYKDRANELTHRYAAAAKAGDSDEMSELRSKWREMQQAQQKNGFKMTPLSTLLKAPVEQRKREAKTIGGVEYTNKNRRFVTETVEE
jgi:hypothetical protein